MVCSVVSMLYYGVLGFRNALKAYFHVICDHETLQNLSGRQTFVSSCRHSHSGFSACATQALGDHANLPAESKITQQKVRMIQEVSVGTSTRH